MGHFLTSQENLVLSLIHKLLGEPRRNRTNVEYVEMAERAPKLKVLLWKINRALEDMAIAGYSWEICEIWVHNEVRHYQYIKPPISISRETLRKVWAKSGMRELQMWQKQQKRNAAPTY